MKCPARGSINPGVGDGDAVPLEAVEIASKMARVMETLLPDFRQRFDVEHMSVRFVFPRKLQRFSLRVVLHAGRAKPSARWRSGNIINLQMSFPRTINLAGERLA